MSYLSHPDTRQIVDRDQTCLIPSTPLCRPGFESTHKEKCSNYHTVLEVSMEKMLWCFCFFVVVVLFRDWKLTADLQTTQCLKSQKLDTVRHLIQGTGLENGKATRSSHHLSGTQCCWEMAILAQNTEIIPPSCPSSPKPWPRMMSKKFLN